MNQLFFLLPALIPVEAIAPFPVYDEAMEAVNFKGIRYSFHLRQDLEITKHLNGEFRVEHDDCKDKFCGQTSDYRSIQLRDPINIQIVLNPCKNHTGIKIKAKFLLDGGEAFVWTRNWIAIDCSKVSAEAETEPEQETTETAETNFFTENNFQNSLILSSALLAIIAIATTLSVCVICKKRNNEKKKRSEQMKTDENSLYGTYEDGPAYNIVTDENTYYSS